jgi:hypothetical protein
MEISRPPRFLSGRRARLDRGHPVKKLNQEQFFEIFELMLDEVFPTAFAVAYGQVMDRDPLPDSEVPSWAKALEEVLGIKKESEE